MWRFFPPRRICMLHFHGRDFLDGVSRRNGSAGMPWAALVGRTRACQLKAQPKSPHAARGRQFWSCLFSCLPKTVPGKDKEKKMLPQETMTAEEFEQKLGRLHARIDLLPPEQRPHLYELADAILREHRHLESEKPLNHDRP